MIIKLLKKTRSGQSALEIAIVGAVIAAVIFVMAGYFKRGLSGKYKATVDSSLEGQFDPDKGNAFYATNDSGTSESIERSENVSYNPTGKADIETDFSMTYQAAGPTTNDIKDIDGNVVIEKNTDRAPLNSTTVSHFEADWENFTMK